MRTERRRPRLLVLGLGNCLLQDDGVGVHAVRALQAERLPGVRVVEVGTAILDALDLIEWADRILAIDAMDAGGRPGTVYVCGDQDVAGGPAPVSLHELGLKAALQFLPRPPRAEITIIGIQPAVIDYSLDLSPEVAAALPQVLEVARDLLRGWRAGKVVSASA